MANKTLNISNEKKDLLDNEIWVVTKIEEARQETENFIYENVNIYPITLQKFMNCSYRQAHKIITYIKNEYNVKTPYIPSIIFRKYIYAE